jgi:hypothetical protein
LVMSKLMFKRMSKLMFERNFMQTSLACVYILSVWWCQGCLKVDTRKGALTIQWRNDVELPWSKPCNEWDMEISILQKWEFCCKLLIPQIQGTQNWWSCTGNSQ